MLCQAKSKGIRWSERLYKFALVLGHTRPIYFATLRFIRDDLRRRLVHFNLGAHFLDLRRLLFELGHENLYLFLLLANLLLLLRRRHLQLLNFAVQHRLGVGSLTTTHTRSRRFSIGTDKNRP